MSEFNGKKFYGFSLHNDPALTTSTRNFEFRYTRPEQLERAIQKVQLTDLANNVKQRKNLMYCKMKKNGRDISTAYQSRDIDVETHVSRNDNKIRDLSANEVDQLIGRAKSSIELVAPNGPPLQQADREAWCSGEELPVKYTQTQEDLEELDFLQDEDRSYNDDVEFTSILDYRMQRPKWVEIQEETRGRAVKVDIKSPRRKEPQTLCQAYTPGYVPGGMDLSTALSPNMMRDDDNPAAYFIEDSDLEYEMLGRADYTKFCHPRPREDEMVNVSNDSGGFPEFIEIEPQIPCMDLSFLKNASPIRYTDLTDETQEERIENPQMKVYINDRNKKQQQHTDKKSDKDVNKKAEKDATMSTLKKKKKPKHSIACDKAPSVTTPRSKFTKLNDTPRTPRSPHSASPSPRLISRTRSKPPITPRHALKENTVHRGSNHSHHSHHSNRSHHSVIAGSGTDRSLRNIVLSKAIEDLKVEKIAIFGKMTATQERIIEIMDKLRLSLLELYVPENSYEKNKRQKNAFEFSVRFSRNFLYPLKGMIDDLRHTPIEQLNSASSNDACARVASIYALVLQSLQTYQKQLRYFLLDQVPQKLTTLIEMLHQVTTICMEKGLFDRNDAIIECVLERCSKFLGFLEDMHEERFLTARENYRKMNFDKPHANYDLKMFMNDLNMYEPKLVPKVPTYHRHKSARSSQRKLCKSSNSKMPSALNSSSKLMLTKVAEDAIATQIESLEQGSSQGIVQGLIQNSTNDLTNKSSDPETNPLNKIIMEALQKVTKDQVRQVLEPIIQTLGTALDKMNNSEVIEKLLSAFDMKFIPTTTTASTTQDETKKRCDADKYEKEVAAAAGTACGKVVGAKVSASSIGKATKASKAAAQTVTLLQQHKQQNQQQRKQQHECADEDDNDKNDDDENDDTQDDDDDDDDDEEADNHSSNYKLKGGNNNIQISNSSNNNNSNNNRNNINLNLSTLVERKRNNIIGAGDDDDFDIDDADDDDESSTVSESETATEEEDDSPESGVGGGGGGCVDDECNAQLAAANACMNAQMNASVNAQQFDVLYVNKKHPQPLLAERQAAPAPPPSPHQAAPQALPQQQQQQMLAPLPPERLLYQPHKCTQGRKTGAATVREPQRPLSRLQQQQLQYRQQLQQQQLQQQQQQPQAAGTDGGISAVSAAATVSLRSRVPKPSRLYKIKRRNLKPPPPVPTGTPTTSARSKKHEDVLADIGGSECSEKLPPPVTYVEKLHALTKHAQQQKAQQQKAQQQKLVQQQQAQEQAHSHSQPQTPKMTSAQHDKAAASGNVQPVPLINAFGLDKGGGDKKLLFLLQNRCVADALKQCKTAKREEGELPAERTNTGARSRNSGRSASSGRVAEGASCGDFNKSASSIHTSKSAYLRHMQQQQQLLQQQQQQQQHQYQPQQQQQQQQPKQPASPHTKQRQLPTHPAANNKENIGDTHQQQHGDTADNNLRPDAINADQLLNERDHFLHLCGNNRFYANPNYAEPWKVFSRISDKLVNEIVNSVEEDFSIGVSRFVQDFLELETKTHNF